MNRKRKIKQMKKFINAHGIIKQEHKRSKDNYYRKGSYFAAFDSPKLDTFCAVGDVDKYRVYKRIVKEIKMQLKNE